MPGSALVYLHPAAALLTIVLGAYAASLGLRSRFAERGADVARRRHRALAPWLYTFVLLNWGGGLATVWWLRPEMEATESGHFALGSLIAALFTAAALLSRRVPFDTRARAVHPVIGATALLLCGVQIFLGLQLLP